MNASAEPPNSPRFGANVVAVSALETLCLACGLCCDGTLFTRVPLRPEESVPDLLDARSTATGARYLPQRCAGLTGTTCGAYAQRPLACRRYECLLFGATREGEVSLPEALEVVRRAKTIAPDERDAYLRFHFGRRP